VGKKEKSIKVSPETPVIDVLYKEYCGEFTGSL
jgi:hypothetical protein